jgi:hypothetical protein
MGWKVALALTLGLVGCGDDARARGASTGARTTSVEPIPRGASAPLAEPAWSPRLEPVEPPPEETSPEELGALDEGVSARRPPPSELWTELVHDGPIARATHPGGEPMYVGQQLEQDGKWVRHGRFEAWYPDGQAWEAGSYYLDRPHGLWEWWYEDGTPQARGDYDEGQHTGPWTYWHENGQVLATGVFRADKPVGVWRLYDEQGNLLDERDRGP